MSERSKFLDINKQELIVDAVISINESRRNTLSKYRVESGSEVAENISEDNLRLSINGLVSDALLPEESSLVSAAIKQLPESSQGALSRAASVIPDVTPNFISSKISRVGDIVVKLSKGNPLDSKDSKSDTAKAYLKRLMSERSIFTFSTPSQVFENVVMTSLEFNRDSSTGQSLSFKCTLEQIRFAVSKFDTSTKKTDTNIQQVPPTEEVGNKVAKEASEADKTIALDAFESIDFEGIFSSFKSAIFGDK